MRSVLSWSQKIEARFFSSGYLNSDFLRWDGVSRYAAVPLIVAFSPGHSGITRFHPWSPIATGIIWIAPSRKIPKVAQTTGTVDVFHPRSGISGPTSRGASACPNLHEWWTQPAHVLSYWFSRNPGSSKISSWIWSIISGVVTVLGRPGRGASQVEKSPRLNWATQFLTVPYDVACSRDVSIRMAWISFGALRCR